MMNSVSDGTDQRRGGENVLDSIVDGEHASMVTVVGPEEPATSHQSDPEQNPASDGRVRFVRRSWRA